MRSRIEVREAHAKNLKRIAALFPVGAFTVVTGPSGSGKSALVFDVLGAAAERQHAALGGDTKQHPIPGFVSGLPFSVLIRPQTRTTRHDTVASRLGIFDPLVGHFLTHGQAQCIGCRQPLLVADEDQARLVVAGLPDLTKIGIWVPFQTLDLSQRDRLLQAGILRTRVAGEIVRLENLDELEEHNVFIDSFTLQQHNRVRFAEALDLARQVCNGFESSTGQIRVEHGDEHFVISSDYRCINCGTLQRKLTPFLFNARSREGRCESCDGSGTLLRTPASLHALQSRLLRDAVGKKVLEEIAGASFFPSEVFPQSAQKFETTVESNSVGYKLAALCYVGSSGPVLTKLRQRIEPLFDRAICDTCDGTRISAEARACTCCGIPFAKLLNMSVAELSAHSELFPAATGRVLSAFSDLGIAYLSLSRGISTLSAGEVERVLLARGIRSQLRPIAYLVDEPSAGLHPHDIRGIQKVLFALKSEGNTVIATEHHPALIENADYELSLGPGGGRQGGEVVYQGVPRKFAVLPLSARSLPEPEFFSIPPFTLRNIRELTVSLPLNRVTGVAGVSGSGKSTIIFEGVERAVAYEIARRRRTPETETYPFRTVFSFSTARVRRIRSDLWTLLGLTEEFFPLLARCPSAVVRGLTKRDFAPSTKAHQCVACSGKGVRDGELCQFCSGLGVGPEIRDITFRGYTLASLRDLSFLEAESQFPRLARIRAICARARSLGLGYLRFGDRFSSLSFGEQQRVLLTRFLGRVRSPRGVLLLLDEPVRGLQQAEILPVLEEFRRFTDEGATVVAIEHNPRFLSGVDYLMEIGPGAGEEGGRIVFAGSPAALLESESQELARSLRHS